MGRRWDIDERGRGVGDAAALVPGASELLAALEHPDWVAEDPEAHLLPHLRRWCEREQARLELVSARVRDDATFVVELRWLGDEGDTRGAREAVFALIGSVAESATYVRQRRRDGAGDVDEPSTAEPLVFETATGMLRGDTTFAEHGHTLELIVGGVFS